MCLLVVLLGGICVKECICVSEDNPDSNDGNLMH